jgi:signal transduction histidine kinase
MAKKDLMAAPPPAVLELWERGRERLDALFTTPLELEQRLGQITELLLELCPAASLAVCYLRQGAAERLHTQPAASADLEPAVRALLQEQLSQPVDKTGAKLTTVAMPAAAGTQLYVAAVPAAPNWCVALALALPEQTAAMMRADLAALLPSWAQQLGWHLHLSEQQMCANLRQQWTEQVALGDLAETIGPVLHEMGNVLNHVVLELGALERQIPPEQREKAQKIRQLSRTFVTMLSQYANYRSSKQTKPYPVELATILRQVSADLAEQIGPVQLDLPETLPPVWSSRSSIERLVHLLLLHFAATDASKTPIIICAETPPDKLRLRLEKAAAIPEAWLPHFFEPFFPEREIQHNMELAACHGMVRRLRGNLEITSSPAGTRLTLELPTKSR